jgi:cytochrome P450
MSETQLKSRKTRAIGDALRFTKDPLKFFREIISEAENAPVIPFKVGPLNSVLVNDTSLLRELLNNYETFEKKSITYNEIRKMFDNGIIFSNRDEWRHNRKALNPAFHKQAIEGYFQIFAKRGVELANLWRANNNSAPVNIYSNFVNTTMEITLDVFFNHDLNKEDKQKIVTGIDDLLMYTQKRLLRGGLKFPDFIPVPENVGIARARKGYHEVMSKIFEAKSHKVKDDDRITIIDLLMNAESYFGGPMTPQQITAEASSVMLAGTETTASLLTWMFYELTKHPEVKEKIKKEMESVFGGNDELTGEKLRQLKYSRQTINEVLRLYPPAWLLTRYLSEPASLAGNAFKKGTTFYFSPYIFQRDHSVWTNPDRFDPDRFAAENLSDEQKEHFMPFIMGPRKCIGEEFSIWEALIIMVKTIPFFDWKYPLEREPAIDFNATMRPLSEKGEYEVLLDIMPIT